MLRNRDMEAAYKKVAGNLTENIELPLDKVIKIKDEDYRVIMESYSNMVNEKGDYKKNTDKFIGELLKNDSIKKMHDFLQGLKDFLDENGFLTPNQQTALGKIKGNLGRENAKK